MRALVRVRSPRESAPAGATSPRPSPQHRYQPRPYVVRAASRLVRLKRRVLRNVLASSTADALAMQHPACPIRRHGLVTVAAPKPVFAFPPEEVHQRRTKPASFSTATGFAGFSRPAEEPVAAPQPGPIAKARTDASSYGSCRSA